MNLRQRLKNKDGQLRLRLIFLGLATLPLVLAIGFVVWIVGEQAHRLEVAQIEAITPIVMQGRKDELEHFVQAGRKVLSHFCAKAATDPKARDEGRALLRLMDFGKKTDDNYFFVYQLDGVNVMHPRKPEIEGTSLWNFRDKYDGSFVIQRLIAQAQAGGGFVPYYWDRPSTKQIEPKLGYVELVPECNWIIGTGLYLDHLREAKEAIKTKTELEVKGTRDKIWLISVAAVFMVFVGMLWINLNEQRSANDRLRAMAQKVVQSQEQERTRVARELHDGVSQSLASVKFIFESADIQLDRGKVEKAASVLKQGIAQLIGVLVEVRRISHDLYPTILDDAGLGVALEQLGREFSVRTGLEVLVQVQNLQKLHKDVAKALYRFAQQALGNIEAHAKAQKVDILLNQHPQGISLRIEDNGVGFDAIALMAQRRDGLGLTNMRERIEMLGGVFALQSQPGSTVLKAFFPSQASKL